MSQPGVGMMAEILVVDDDRDVAQSIELALRRRGFRIALAHSGVEALKLLRRYRPDLVLLDVLMPGMSGIEVCRRLRADENTAEMPIIFLTARGQERDRRPRLPRRARDHASRHWRADQGAERRDRRSQEVVR